MSGSDSVEGIYLFNTIFDKLVIGAVVLLLGLYFQKKLEQFKNQ